MHLPAIDTAVHGCLVMRLVLLTPVCQIQSKVGFFSFLNNAIILLRTSRLLQNRNFGHLGAGGGIHLKEVTINTTTVKIKQIRKSTLTSMAGCITFLHVPCTIFTVFTNGMSRFRYCHRHNVLMFQVL